ncbi:MAG: hypothetical protein A2144_10080 [Chloroflexi bacterium RBG_16_50_9]|nr:MAG: hypothetical protein A2144_10080 [Chloroflexi bacterium RBG_16_50_9]
MKGIIVYYSATGSTARIAKAIHRGMRGLMAECDIVQLKKADPRDMTKYDVIGIGAPIWFFREPANVRLFIYNMPRLEGKLGFPFCSHGAAPAGFMFSIASALKRKGLTIIGYNDWYGAVNQVLHMPKPYVTDGHPDEIDLRDAENFGREMAERAHRIVAGETSLIPSLPKGPKADPLWRPQGLRRTPPPSAKQGESRQVSPPLPQRKIDIEKCTYPECTLCVDNCLMNSIDFSRNPPVFKRNCINCSLCNRLCPEAAMEVDEETLQSRTQKIIRMDKCTYPECTLCVDHCPMNSIDFSVNPPVFKQNCEGDDLCWVICPEGAIEITNFDRAHAAKTMKNADHPFVKLLEEAEAKGRFRRLVPLDKVGWDNTIYKNPHHPRFVIEEE